MPRPLPLKEEILVTEQTRCELCGADLAGVAPDREEHTDLEVVRRLAILAADDWKAATVMLLYTAYPNATISFIADRIRIGRTEVCEARDRVAEVFPALAPVLALKTPRAEAQRERRLAEYEETQKTPDMFTPKTN